MNPSPLRAMVADIQLPEHLAEFYGDYCAKIKLAALNHFAENTNHKRILVTATNPTPMGEGKTVTSIGLSAALNQLGVKAVATLRQGSMGPLFGVKGGGAGGGKARILPTEESMLHLSGDIHAIGQAHNQISALIDHSLYQKNTLDIDSTTINFPRVLDVNDRFLRDIEIGRDAKDPNCRYKTRFDITAASELMAIVALANGHFEDEVISSVRTRLQNMVVAQTKSSKPITVKDLRADGAALVILKKALQPNLMRTADNTPVLLHMGPFANIAHGCSSIIADQVSKRLFEYSVTESGFGADLGFEKYLNIKCRQDPTWPSCVVLVTTVRAMKYHSGQYKKMKAKELASALVEKNIEYLEQGAALLKHHIKVVKSYGLPLVVAINQFEDDQAEELNRLRDLAISFGAENAVTHQGFLHGGHGVQDLAEAVLKVTRQTPEPVSVEHLYHLEDSIEQKIAKIAGRHYLAKGVELSPLAQKQQLWLQENGFANLPICIAKTPFSLSHDADAFGIPQNYTFPVDSLELKAGAGFIVARSGSIFTMPGLGAQPIAQWVSMNNKGDILGLY
ncbi:MAG: formate--tetrahydrofolate ligase [Oligoflexales bacterium]|nr:formate--tetrahydrofolate ligase [Oligoflexales bacterium]